VTQCENDHSLCGGCCRKLKKVCPSCQNPVGSIKNRTVEKILDSVQAPCKNASHGCKKMLKISEREDHEELLCSHQPFKCPVVGCPHKGSTLTIPQHLTEHHQVKTVESNLQGGAVCIRMQPSDRFVMVKSAKQKLFLLHHLEGIESSDMFFCTSFGAHKRSYDIRVTHGIHSRVYSMYKVLAHNIQGWAEGLEELHRDTLIFPRRPGTLRGIDVLISDLQSQHKDSDSEDESGAEEESEPLDEPESEPE
jgi:hypothetical protein